jgi:hypothetical protein
MISFNESFEAFAPGETWPEGFPRGAWTPWFNGYGSIAVAREGSNVLVLQPAAATSADETHAALVVSSARAGDLRLKARLRTIRQLREGTPNPWETAWLLWHLQDLTRFYYLALKTNGWELGKEQPGSPGGQRFIATGDAPAASVGKWADVEILQIGVAITITIDGIALGTFTDTESPYLDGAIGLYTEDAKSAFDDVSLTPLS